MSLKRFISIISVFIMCISVLPVLGVVYAEQNLIVNNMEFYASSDGDGEILPDLNGAEAVSVKVDISNGSSAIKKAGVYLAYYNNNTILDVTYNVFEINPNSKISQSVGMNVSEAKPGRYVTAFVWDETDEAHRPVVDEEILTATENIYVSPDGNDDSEGTFSSPIKTVSKAKELAKTRNNEMSDDLYIYMKEGTYCLDETLSFATEDGGTNGKNIIYTSYNRENVVISGGRKIKGWEIHDTEKNIWKTEIDDIEKVRELYVNGTKATRAQSAGRVYPKGFYKEIVDGIEKTLGFVVSSDDIGLYNNDGDIQLHFSQIWKNTLLNVDEIKAGEETGTNVIILNQDAFSKTISQSRYVPLRGDTSFYVENAFELLDEAGEFYFDEKTKCLYYMSDSGANMADAEVYVPILDKLMEIKGDNLDNKVRNIIFDGITFAHATRSDMDNGYLGDQAQTYDPIYSIKSSYPLDNTFVGGNIRLFKAENISFVNNTFTGLSAVGLGLYDGAENIKIEGNFFYDLGDSAITAGLPTDAFMEEEYDYGVNVALFKPVTSNGIVSTEATRANDGDRTTIWSNPSSLKSDYLQIDLGKEYTISEVRLKSRLGTTASATETYKSQTVHRRGFNVYASNDVDFKDGGVTLATVSNAEGNEFDYDDGFAGQVLTQEKFRYIRFSTTVNKHFPLAEIEVISPDESAQNKEICKNTVISNNYIARAGDTNWGAPGIQLYHTENISVLNNTLKDLPYSGICLGWGWNNKSGSETTKNNTINYNMIDGVAMRMYDAGGIYLNGPQFNTQINYNYIKNQKNIYFALYPDSGADNFTATNNVFEDVDVVFMVGREGNLSDKTDIIIKNNYSTSVKYNYAFVEGNNSIVEAPAFYLRTKSPTAVTSIKEAAGLQDDYKKLILKVPESNNVLKTEDIYGDVIDRHVGSYEDTITSLTDYNMVLYYLSYKIDTAKKILDSGKSYVDFRTYQEFKNTISSIEKTRTNYYTITQPTAEEKEAGGSVHTTENLDRSEVIKTRILLENAIEKYLNSIS